MTASGPWSIDPFWHLVSALARETPTAIHFRTSSPFTEHFISYLFSYSRGLPPHCSNYCLGEYMLGQPGVFETLNVFFFSSRALIFSIG